MNFNNYDKLDLYLAIGDKIRYIDNHGELRLGIVIHIFPSHNSNDTIYGIMNLIDTESSGHYEIRQSFYWISENKVRECVKEKTIEKLGNDNGKKAPLRI